MAKPGKNKKRCEKYRNSGHKAENKRLRQEHHQRKLDYFARRKAAGKTVNKSSGVTVGEGHKSNVTEKEMISKRPDHQLPLSWWTGVMRKLNNHLNDETQKAKKIDFGGGGNHHNKKARKAEYQAEIESSEE